MTSVPLIPCGDTEQFVAVVAPTHEEIRRLTEAIRGDRQRSGELGAGEKLTRHLPLNWTEAQKKETKHYQPGMVLAFHKATKEAGKNEAVEVVKVEKDKLTARKENGQEITLTRRQAQAFSVHEKREIEVAAGDKLLLEANRWETKLRVTNGELVTVAKVERGRIELEDGRILPANYRSFDHGYAVTAHRSQGQTVDAVIVSGDRMSKELFYVAATRGRESLTVITSDKEQLREAIGISGERMSATELAQKAGQQSAGMGGPRPVMNLGLNLGLNLGAAVELARSQAVWQEGARAAEELERRERQRLEQELGQKQERRQSYGIGYGI
jgi:ATP-dependent exoDNAse (exonuclease V) alpha subunit